VTDSLSPTIIVVSQEPFLIGLLEKGSFSFALRFVSEIPSLRESPRTIKTPTTALGDTEVHSRQLYLVPFPLNQPVDEVGLFHPFMGYGPEMYMEEAFNRGAWDFIREPFSVQEFRTRSQRLLGTQRTYEVPFSNLNCNLKLIENTLWGPRGSVELRPEEAKILKIFCDSAPQRVSRGAIRRYLWPTVSDSSRVVDITISRLRRLIQRVQNGDRNLQIRSIRRFGYYATIQKNC
jgi:hypothetical protein